MPRGFTRLQTEIIIKNAKSSILLTLTSTTDVIGVLGATLETREGRAKKNSFLMSAPLTYVVQAMLTLTTVNII